MKAGPVGLRPQGTLPQIKKVLPPPVRKVVSAAAKRVRLLGNRGDVVQCPCCGHSFQRFLPHGREVQSFARRRPNARCQNCGALERHRLIWLYIQQQTDLLTRPLRFFHSAPESQMRKHLNNVPTLDYVPVDIDPRRGGLQVDLANIPMADESFDAVMCNHVLEHIIDDHRAMSELYRVLKPGGWSIITVPQDFDREQTFEDASVVSPEERLEVFGQEDHVRIYGLDFPERLRNVGFQVEEVFYTEQLPAETVRHFGLTADGLIYRCSK